MKEMAAGSLTSAAALLLKLPRKYQPDVQKPGGVCVCERQRGGLV